MNIADIALSAAKAEEEASKREAEAKVIRERDRALRKINLYLDRVVGDKARVMQSDELSGPSYKSDYWVEIQVDDDATLVITANGRLENVDGATATVRPSDQLYWNLTPAQQKHNPRKGGVYGCYGLDRLAGRYAMAIESLSDLGRAINMTREARAKWRTFYGKD